MKWKWHENEINTDAPAAAGAPANAGAPSVAASAATIGYWWDGQSALRGGTRKSSLQNFDLLFALQTTLQSPRNFGKANFRRLSTFQGSTLKNQKITSFDKKIA